MKRLTISQYRKREDAYPGCAATIRRYIDEGVITGEKIQIGKKCTYFVHTDIKQENDDLLLKMIQG